MASCDIKVDETDNDEEIKIMERSVLCNGLKMDLVLTSHQCKCLYQEEISKGKKKNSESMQYCLDWCDIVKAEIGSQKNVRVVIIHYIEQQKKKKLHVNKLIVSCPDGEEQKLVSTIQEHCQKVPGRPKKVFVVINPVGGNHKGEATYQKEVAPIFELAGIETKVVVSERSKHCLEIGESQDFSDYGGCVIAGGDGTYQEVFQGYFKQLQKNASIEIIPENIDKFIKPKTPFCILPTGSSNGLSTFNNDGVTDCVTAALRILKGKVHYQNAIAVFEGSNLIGTGVLGLMIGLPADLMKFADQKRWMGKYRYAYCSLIVFMKRRRFFNAKVELLTAQTNPSLTYQENESQENENEEIVEWMDFDSNGKQYVCVSIFACALNDSGNGTAIDFWKPTCAAMIDTGCTNLELLKTAPLWSGKKITSVIPNFHLMKNVKGLRCKILRDESETAENVTGARAKARDLEHYLYLDGEVVHTEKLEIDASLMHKFIPVFSCLPSRS